MKKCIACNVNEENFAGVFKKIKDMDICVKCFHEKDLNNKNDIYYNTLSSLIDIEKEIELKKEILEKLNDKIKVENDKIIELNERNDLTNVNLSELKDRYLKKLQAYLKTSSKIAPQSDLDIKNKLEIIKLINEIKFQEDV